MDKINAEGIPEPMLLALYARAKESKSGRNYIYDGKAVEVVERLDYDFADEDKNTAMGNGPIARMILLDKMAADYIKKNPNATIINLASGMDTRFYRVDNGTIRWYDLDLPDTIEARKRLLGEEGRVVNIPKSALDDTWAEDVETEGPLLVIAQMLTMYLTQQDVQKIFKIIRTHFKQADVFVEVSSPYAVKNAVETTPEGSRPKYTWGVKNGKELQKILPEFKAVKDVSLIEGLKKMYPIYYVLRLLPSVRNISNKIIVLQKNIKV